MKHILLLAAAVAVAPLAAASAQALDAGQTAQAAGESSGQADAQKDKELTKAEKRLKAENKAERHKEMVKEMQPRFEAMDADKSGDVSESEYVAFERNAVNSDAFNEPAARANFRMGAGGGGSLSLDQYADLMLRTDLQSVVDMGDWHARMKAWEAKQVERRTKALSPS